MEEIELEETKSHSEEREFPCPDCPKTFAERSSLGRHKLVHSREDLYQCVVSNKRIRGQAAVKTHKKTHANRHVNVVLVKEEKEELVKVKARVTAPAASPPKENEKSETAPSTVNMATAKIPSAKKSLPMHLNPPPKQTASSSGIRRQSQKQGVLRNSIRKTYNLPLSKYIMPTNQEQCFPCQYCPQQFSTLRSRTRHVLLYHKGNFPYQCEFCDKSFLRSSSLTQHSTFHTDERPFRCNMCVASFRYHSNLYSHRFTHKEYGILLCTVCGQSFRHYSTLWSHVQKHRQEMGGGGPSAIGVGRGRKSKLTQVIRYSNEGMPPGPGPKVKVEVTEDPHIISDPAAAPLEEFEYHTPTYLAGEDVDMIMSTAEEANSDDQYEDQDLPKIFIEREIVEPEFVLRGSQDYRIKMPPPPPLIPIKREPGFQQPTTMTLISKPKTASHKMTTCQADAVNDAPSSVDPLSGELTSGSESRIHQLFNLPELIIDEVVLLGDEDQYGEDSWSREQQQQQQIQFYRSQTRLQPRKVTVVATAAASTSSSSSSRMPKMIPTAPPPARRVKSQFWCSTGIGQQLLHQQKGQRQGQGVPHPQLQQQEQQRPRLIQINSSSQHQQTDSQNTPNQQHRQVYNAPHLQQQLAHVLPDLTKKTVTPEVKEQQQVHRCEYCEEEFDDTSELRLHKLCHQGGLSYIRTTGSINVE